ncbi:DUF6588 family protein [Marispirochaeta sp.]|uniref:DUF6588 family protein n=1 Tax=Marispirochaeta sp. TaxID=2038653 RepID=UPI0029C74BAC|nr:DUF6588 family protein [Marispirochaeta sp.]
MKRLLIITTVLMFIVSFSLTAQITNDLDDFMSTFETFADDAAPSIPMLADVGLRWSDSYIGGFPHFGVGASLGFIVVPIDDIEGMFAALDIAIPKELKDLGGLPVPANAVEARIGGFVWPFDIGIKAGYLPEFAKDAMTDDVAVDYKMFGFDLRYRLVEEGLLMPEVSVGAGYTWLEGMVSTSVGENATVNDGTYNLFFSSPDVFFGWRSSVIDAKVQVSKRFLFILRPYAGLGVSYGISEAGGGYNADVTTDAPGGYSYWKDKYGVDASSSGAEYYSEANGAAFRAYLGTSVELLFAKLDLSGTYNPVSGAYGGQLNLRAQF